MPTKILESEEEIKDFVRGCTFLGTGGGGRLAFGEQLLLDDFKEGREIKWVDGSEIADDTWMCTTWGMGTIAPVTKETKARMEDLGLTQEKVARPLLEAVETLQEYSGIKAGALIAFEIGGVNTPGPIDATLRLGIPIVDGDYSGRALPEVVQALPCLYNKKITPIACCDRWGNVSIIKEAASYVTAERLGKMISVAGFGRCGQAGFLLPWKEVKGAFIPGTLTYAHNIGKAIRQARESGVNPVEAAVEATSGWLLFEGRVSKRETEDREGYYCGITTIEGIDKFKGHSFRIFFKNENHITWLDGKAYVTSPDIIEVVQLDTAEPITNSDLAEGDSVAVVGVKHESYRSKEGIALVGPRRYGYEIEYVPIEKVIKQL